MPTRTPSTRKPKNLKATLGTMIHYMGRHKYTLLAVVVMVALSVGANLLGTYMIKPVVNSLAGEDPYGRLARGVVVTAVIYAVGVLSAFGYTQMTAKSAQEIVYDIRKDLFEHIQGLPLSFFDQRKSGDVMSYFTNDVDTISDALNNSFSSVVKNFMQITGTMFMLIVLNWRLSLLVAVAYVLMFLYIRLAAKKSKMYYTKQQKSLGELDGYIQEMVSGQKVVKTFNHEQKNLEGFRKRNVTLRDAGTGAQAYAATMIPCVVTISYINYAVVAFIGGMMVLRGWTDIGSLASYLVFVRQAAAPINQFTQQTNFLLSSLAGAERIFEVLKIGKEEDFGDVELVNACRDAEGTLHETKERTGLWAWKEKDGNLIAQKGEVVLRNVRFSYDGKKEVLKDVSLYAKSGQTIAFVGSTGAGKTTITNLINRFYDIDSGNIFYDGIDIMRIRKDSLRSSLGMVLQDTHLFTGTIRENIRYGRLDATDEEVEKAAVSANADSFIRRLPKGYDTMVTNDGANLSQGQRQLLAIARAAVADPPVLILDEATSNIDTRTEDLIEKGMDALMENRTVFVIAHRLSTVRNADAIMVLENGVIMERGNHDDLMKKNGIYHKLYTGLFELS